MKDSSKSFLANLRKQASVARETGAKIVNVFRENEDTDATEFERILDALEADTLQPVVVDDQIENFQMRTAVVNSAELLETIEGKDGKSYDRYALICRDEENNQTLRSWTIRLSELNGYAVGDLIKIPCVHIPKGSVAVSYGKESEQGKGDGAITFVEPIRESGCYQTFSKKVAEKLSETAVAAFYMASSKIATSLKAETAVKKDA
jgi:hypothetical protein